MLGILILLLVSHLMLRLAGNQHPISFYLPKKVSAVQFCLGVLWPAVYYCSYEFLLAFLVENPLVLNPDYSLYRFLDGLAYIVKSVAFEELVFRGALCYLLWKKLGAGWAVLLSASCFGVYHWFCWQAFGNPVKMAMIFFSTGSMGLVLGYAFVRTGSMYLSLALHLGVNLCTMLIFSHDQGLGKQLLVKALEIDGAVPAGYIGMPMLVMYFIGFQLLTFLLIRWLTRSSSALTI